jgi:VCBS repeat-containing protein
MSTKPTTATLVPEITAQPSYHALEQRIAFDAALAAMVETVADQAHPADVGAQTSAAEIPHAAVRGLADAINGEAERGHGSVSPSATTAAVIVFVDAAVSDPAVISAAAPAGAEIIVLDRSSDGLSQIAAYLVGRSQVSTIHIVSHGAAGELNLGNAEVTTGSLATLHADEAAIIRNAMSADADILIYGCDVAAGAKGQAFIDALSNATAADVAASTDDTGHAGLGGDWDLETRTGLIEAGLIDAPEWNGVLAPLTISATSAPVVRDNTGAIVTAVNTGGTVRHITDVTKMVGATAIWQNAGTVGGTTIDLRATVLSVTDTNSASGLGFDPSLNFAISNGDDPSVRIESAEVRIKWEVLQAGTNIIAKGDVGYFIRDIDAFGDFYVNVGGVLTKQYAVIGGARPQESVRADFDELDSYTTESLGTTHLTVGLNVDPDTGQTITNPLHSSFGRITATNLVDTEFAGSVSGVKFSWNNVSAWEITYRVAPPPGAVQLDGPFAFDGVPDASGNYTSQGQRFFDHDGDGDLTFVDPYSVTMRDLDLDASAAGSGYTNTFTEGGSAVAIVDADVDITGLDTRVVSATITLTNAKAGDQLLVNGSTSPAGTVNGLSYTITTVGSVQTVQLAGATSDPTVYETALTLITFKNISGAPDTTDRQIQVSFSNGTVSSGTALSIIHVVPVNDSPALDLNSAWDPHAICPDPAMLDARVILSGAYDSGAGLMRDDLRAAGLIPLTEPYTDLGYHHAVGGGGETTTAGVLAVTGSNAIVDWIVVELRNGSDEVVASRAALLQRDGDIVDVDGTSTVTFNAPAGDYTVTVQHRNHLGVTTAGTVSFDGTSASSVDFTSASLDVANPSVANGLERRDLDGAGAGTLMALWAGDANRDGTTSLASDQAAIHAHVLADPGNLLGNANYISNGYATTDLDMDGRTIHQGPGNDTDVPFFEVFYYENQAGAPISLASDIVGQVSAPAAVVTAIDPACLSALIDHAVTFTEDGGPVAVADVDADAFDVDDNITTLIIVAAGMSDGAAEVVTIASQQVALGADVTLSGIIVGGSSVNIAYVAATGTFTITNATGASNAIPQADLDTLIRGITYENTSQDATAGDRTLTFTATDSGNATSAPAVSTINVVPVNDPPVATNDTISVTEDTAVTQNVLGNDTDAESDPLTISAAAIDIDGDGNPETLTLGVATPLVDSGGKPIGTITVAANGDVTFAPAPDFTGPVPILTYTPNDGTIDGASASVVFGPITPVADQVAAVAPPDQTTPEDTPLVFSSANGNAITLVDPDGVAGGNVIVRFAVPASAGTLQLGGITGLLTVSGNGTSEIIATGSVAAINAALNGLTFTPVADWNGTVPSDLTITMTRPTDLGFLNAGFEQPDFPDTNSVHFALDTAVPGWDTSATDHTIEFWDSGFSGVPAFEGDQFVELNAYQVSTLSQTFTPTSAGGDLTLTFAHRGRAGTDVMNVTAIDLGADGVLGGGDDTTLFSQNYATGNAAWKQYQAALGTATGHPILLQFNSVSAAGGATVGNFLDAISIYDSSLSATTSVGITVIPVADTVDDTVTTLEDTATTFNVLTGANGAEADNFESAGRAVTSITQPVNGSVTFAANGTMTYTPDADFNGTDSFTYTVMSPAGITETATITVTVSPVNDIPDAIDDTNTVSENGPAATGDVTPGTVGQDSDLDGDTLTVAQINGAAFTSGTAITLPSGSQLTMNANGSYSYDPNGAFETLGVGMSATDSFTYQVSDGNGGFAIATVSLTINGVNDVPIAVADTNIGTEQQTLSGNLITGTVTAGSGAGGPDTDVDGGPLVVSALSLGSIGSPIVLTHGTLTVQSNGSYKFVPNATANALDQGQIITEQVTYTVADGNGGTAQATLTLALTGQNDVPFNALAIPQTTATDGGSVSFPTFGAFHDPDGEALTYTLAPSAPAWLAIDPTTGVVTGTPPADASKGGTLSNGSYTFGVIATDPHGASVKANATVIVVNLPPVAVDDAASIGENATSVAGNVITDPATGDADTAPDNDPLTVVAANQAGNPITIGTPFVTAAGGTLTLHGDGSYTFDPGTACNGLDTGETATETISYTVSDGNGGTAAATLVITIAGANDTPVVVDPANPGTPDNPVPATDPLDIIPDVATTDGAPLAPIDVGSYVVDPDGEPLVFTLSPTTPPWVVIDPATGVITGTPPADASQHSNTGNPSEYLIIVTATDPDGALVTTTVTLSIVNLDPVAVDDAASIGEDATSVAGNVITDPATGDADTAPDNDPLTVVAANQAGNPITIGTPFVTAAGGTLTLHHDGSYTFAPGTAYNGLDTGETATETISYTVSDGNGGTATATLVITIAGANDTPVVVDPANPGTPANPAPATDPLDIIPDVATTDGAPLAPINVGSYVVDPDGEPLVFTLSPTTPAWVVIDPATGVITGTPPADASQHSNTGNPGEYRIIVTATDPDGALVTTTVTLSIVNLPPVAVNDAGTADRGQSTTIQVLANDSDGGTDHDPLFVVLADADHGTVVINSDGTITFSPDWGYEGQALIRYRISDGNGGFADAVVRISVTADPAAPLATTPNPEIPRSVAAVERLSVSGAVLETLKALTGRAQHYRPGTDGIVVDAVHDLTRDIQVSGGTFTGEKDIAGISNFSLKFTDNPVAPGVTIETFVQRGMLIIHLGTTDANESDTAVEWKVQRLDGRPMPDWLRFAGRDLLMGQRPADEEVLDLRFTSIFADGTTLSKDVRINAPAGELQPLRLGKQGMLIPFWEQIRAEPLLKQSQIDNLGRLLEAAE